jgi:histidine ammonia-lyase
VTFVVTAPEDLDPFSIRRIANGTPIRLDETLLAAVAARRKRVLSALTRSARPLFGVNTGMGRLAGTVLTPAHQADHQARLLVGRAVGGPPWLTAEDVRAVFAVRLRGLLMPETGASAELARFLTDRLNDGFVPAVPRSGLGSAGEIIPLSHAFQAFLGIGTVLENGQEVPAQQALSARGVAPYPLGPKEGISLLQGTPVAIAHALSRGEQASLVVDKQLVACAMSVDALGAPRGVYRPVLGGPDQVLTRVLTEVHELTTDASERPELVQAPVSVRVAPHAVAYARRTLAELEAAAGRALAMPTDSPAFVDGEFVSTAGFHAAELGLRVGEVVPVVLTDRPLGPEITALVHALRSWRSGPWAPRGGSAG